MSIDSGELPVREEEDSLEELKGRASAPAGLQLDLEDFEEELLDIDLPDLPGHEPEVRIIPKQVDEFICTKCFLVYHRSQLRSPAGDPAVCSECI